MRASGTNDFVSLKQELVCLNPSFSCVRQHDTEYLVSKNTSRSIFIGHMISDAITVSRDSVQSGICPEILNFGDVALVF